MRSARALQKYYVRLVPDAFYLRYGKIDVCCNKNCEHYNEKVSNPDNNCSQYNFMNNCSKSIINMVQ